MLDDAISDTLKLNPYARTADPSFPKPEPFTEHGSNSKLNDHEHNNDAAEAKAERTQALLNKKLGPEYLATRAGGGGMKLTYVEGWKAINLANEVFGFNGQSTAMIESSGTLVARSAAGTYLLPQAGRLT